MLIKKGHWITDSRTGNDVPLDLLIETYEDTIRNELLAGTVTEQAFYNASRRYLDDITSMFIMAKPAECASLADAEMDAIIAAKVAPSVPPHAKIFAECIPQLIERKMTDEVWDALMFIKDTLPTVQFESEDKYRYATQWIIKTLQTRLHLDFDNYEVKKLPGAARYPRESEPEMICENCIHLTGKLAKYILLEMKTRLPEERVKYLNEICHFYNVYTRSHDKYELKDIYNKCFKKTEDEGTVESFKWLDMAYCIGFRIDSYIAEDDAYYEMTGTEPAPLTEEDKKEMRKFGLQILFVYIIPMLIKYGLLITALVIVVRKGIGFVKAHPTGSLIFLGFLVYFWLGSIFHPTARKTENKTKYITKTYYIKEDNSQFLQGVANYFIHHR